MTTSLEQAIGKPVSRETLDQLAKYGELLRTGAGSQNLVSASTLDTMWERHIVDSAQLTRFEPNPGAAWVDIGSGAGLPGIIIGILVDGPVTLVEPRRLRVEFLSHCVATLGLSSQVRIEGSKVENIRGSFDVITARAVAPLNRLLGMAHHLSHGGTIWALPKGQNAKSELAEAQRSWQCVARVEPSCTDPEARILVLSKVKAKSNR